MIDETEEALQDFSAKIRELESFVSFHGFISGRFRKWEQKKIVPV
jgi:hypothetical protein